MVTPLDEVRERIGLRPESPVQVTRTVGRSGATPVGLADVSRAGRFRADEVSRRTRMFIGGAGVGAAMVAITHGLLAGALARDHAGPWNAARAMISWPSPVAQQVLAAVAALALLVIALPTDGYKHVSRRLSWPLLTATIAAVLGAGPMILVCAVTAVVWAVIIVLVIAVIVVIIAILAMAA